MREIAPLVDPSACSELDLREIIETDPNASPDYQRELDRRKRHQDEVSHWEDKFGIE